jgi:TPR repeat protein
MFIAKIINSMFFAGRLAFYAQPGYAGHPTRPLQRTGAHPWRAALAVVGGGAVLLAVAAGQSAAVQPAQEAAWLSHLAKSGDAGAQLQLGLAYRDGRYGLTPDNRTSLRWLTQAAANGQIYAADLAGTAYADGRGAERDLTAARHWWTLAARGGNAHAAQRLGASLASVDPAEADHWLERAAAQGNRRAEQDLHTLYSRHAAPARDLGLGKDRLGVLAAQLDSPTLKTIAAGRNLLLQSTAATQSADTLVRDAQAGNPTAEFQLGLRYRDGAWNVDRDTTRAEYWLQRAAADGNRLAARALTDRHPG